MAQWVKVFATKYDKLSFIRELTILPGNRDWIQQAVLWLSHVLYACRLIYCVCVFAYVCSHTETKYVNTFLGKYNLKKLTRIKDQKYL